MFSNRRTNNLRAMLFVCSMDSIFNRPMPDIAAVLKSNDISAAVQAHLLRVYAVLAFGVTCTAGGVILGGILGIAGGWLSLLVTFGALFWLVAQQDKENTPKRLGIFALFTGAQGVGLASLVAAILAVDPSILITAMVCSLAVFLSFSGFALFSQRRSLLYLGGMLSSALTILVISSFVSRMWGGGVSSLELFAGLAIFVGYVVFDTQIIIEKAATGSTDFVGHAVDLYLDLVNLFVRIAIILAKNSEKRSEKERTRK